MPPVAPPLSPCVPCCLLVLWWPNVNVFKVRWNSVRINTYIPELHLMDYQLLVKLFQPWCLLIEGASCLLVEAMLGSQWWEHHYYHQADHWWLQYHLDLWGVPLLGRWRCHLPMSGHGAVAWSLPSSYSTLFCHDDPKWMSSKFAETMWWLSHTYLSCL